MIIICINDLHLKCRRRDNTTLHIIFAGRTLKTLKKVIRWFRKHLIAHNLGQSQSIVQIKF